MKHKMKEKNSVGIVTLLPVNSSAGITPLLNLVDLTQAISNKIYLILVNVRDALFKGSDKISTYRLRHEPGSNIFSRIIKHIFVQLKISYMLVKMTGKTNTWFFFIGGETLTLPMLTIRLLRKKAVLIFAGDVAGSLRAENDNFYGIVALLSKINCEFAERIILYSPNLIEEWGLEKYRKKISIAHEHFLEFDKFKIEKPLSERDNLLGYIGRLSEGKGILNFMEAIPNVVEREDSIGILIGGEGQLRTRVEQYLGEENLNNKAKFVGWIPHDELPKYLNDLKLLVLPSYTEGLPNIMLEAMACGTPVLATPVGAVPDVIKDGETGFIMKDNSPKCIAKNVVRALNYPNLEEIARNARVLVKKEFTYEAAVERYRGILADLSSK